MATRPMLSHPDVLVLGAGVIGLSLALELRLRGLRVAVAERGTPLAQASHAAAGMLAVADPRNPLELADLSRLSGSLYPEFLAKLKDLSGMAVPFQTEITVQTMPDGSTKELKERSIDPRQLAPALLRAAEGTGVVIVPHTSTDQGAATECNQMTDAAENLVYATGAWSCGDVPVTPRKGQMLRVRVPHRLSLSAVHRAEHIYVVPRTQGAQAGTALIGATVEDAGFDTSTSASDLAELRRLAANLVPELGDETLAPMVEAWAGLRPATPDGLPALGQWQPRESRGLPAQRRFMATGHFRNGILLAPATAIVLADLIQGRVPKVALQHFSPGRFSCATVRR